MPKTRKPPSKRAKASPPASKPAPRPTLASVLGAAEPDDLLVRTRSTVDKAISALDQRIDALITQIGEEDEYSRDNASHLAWLTKLAAGVMGDIRKIEEAERKEAGRLSPQLVMAHLRGLPSERRAHVVRELVAMDDAGGNLLST